MSRQTFEMLSAVLEYPQAGYVDLVKEYTAAVAAEIEPEDKGVSDALTSFRDGISNKNREELEELYTRTFDLNPVCSLDLGWHLYAENYDRGAFLVKMREALRTHGIPETNELPDHLPSVLTLLARLPEEEGGALVGESVLPALKKMIGGFGDQGNPYGSLIKAIEGILLHRFSQETRSIHP